MERCNNREELDGRSNCNHVWTVVFNRDCMHFTDAELSNKYKYPNLIKELVKSGYSFCTVGDWLGLGSRCAENDMRIYKKLTGLSSMCSEEGFQLSTLLGCSFDYLFSTKQGQ